MWKSGSTVPCQARRRDTSSVQGTIETVGSTDGGAALLPQA
jgi:hypothetical protein